MLNVKKKEKKKEKKIIIFRGGVEIASEGKGG
jgi:hypothetical protein